MMSMSDIFGYDCIFTSNFWIIINDMRNGFFDFGLVSVRFSRNSILVRFGWELENRSFSLDKFGIGRLIGLCYIYFSVEFGACLRRLSKVVVTSAKR